MIRSFGVRFLRILAFAVWALAAGAAHAQAWPSKPLRLVVPFPPGGPTDILGRLIGQKIAEGLGQPVVIDNSASAGGTVGSEAASKAPADGYTLLYGSTGTLSIVSSIYADLGYDPAKSFAPISRVASGPLMLIINPQVPARTLTEFIDLARSRPGKYNFASSGNGSPLQLAGELFKSITGVSMVHVPYKGGAAAINGVLAGDVQAVFEGLPSTASHIRSGKLRALAVAGPRRLTSLPDVPTTTEAGLPEFQATFWNGIVAPAGTPKPVVERLNAEVQRALATPEMRETMARLGVEPAGTTPEQFGAFIESEIAKWGRVVKLSGAKRD